MRGTFKVYISGNAIVILGGAHNLLQTIYVDDTDALQAVVINEFSGKIAVCGGRDIFVYHAYRIHDEAPKVRGSCPMPCDGLEHRCRGARRLLMGIN